MRYRAITDERRRTPIAYMQAMGVNAIPAAFAIDRSGRLTWQGHPMMLDKPVAVAVASPTPAHTHEALGRARRWSRITTWWPRAAP